MNHKYIIPLIIYLTGLAICIILIVLFLRPRNYIGPIPFLDFLTKGNATGEFVIMYILWPFLLLPIGFLCDHGMTRLIIWLHKVITFRHCEYLVVVPIIELRRSARSLLSRIIIPAFFSLALGFLLVTNIHETLFFATPQAITSGTTVYAYQSNLFEKSQALIVASILTLPLTYLICSPLWLLEDAGVTFFQKQQQERQSINIQGVARYFNNILKGYISLTTIYAFISYVISVINDYFNFHNLTASIMLISVISVPLLLVSMLIPGTTFHEARFSREVPAFLARLIDRGIADFDEKTLPKYIPKSTLNRDSESK